jgi:hypothetical protein
MLFTHNAPITFPFNRPWLRVDQWTVAATFLERFAGVQILVIAILYLVSRQNPRAPIDVGLMFSDTVRK